ncbi:maleylpyruvate isomerase family mycothiol-dependent enzyme [Streptomyces sp. 8N706]|uniref:maleylpyruvate isomerase family mycothiol-dependent enzyme n=1 Tax=Streptomyces sp. 8N706 TaxID=3457416 RepID=UPI003FD55300
MTPVAHDQYCNEIVAQTGLLRSALAGADLSATVPTCPDWALRDLALHVGRAHRWAEALVRDRATAYLPHDQLADTTPEAAGPAGLDAWLAAGAERLAATLREAGPDTDVWTWALKPTSAFWARRMTHETVIHRADAQMTVGQEFTVDPVIAADTVDEWLEILATPEAAAFSPRLADLRGSGRSIHLHATDTPATLNAEWLITLGENGFSWRRAHAKATVAVRGPMADVLRVFYRRLPADSDRVEVLGEPEVLDFWLERVSFG